MKSMPPSHAPGPRTGQRANRSIKLLAAGAVLGALVTLIAIGVPRGKDALLAVEPSVAAPSPQPLRVPVHACLTWQRRDATDARTVGCEQPHLFEVTGTLDLRDFNDQAPFPDPDRWQKLVAQRCTPLTKQALDDHFDPFGRLTVGAIKPSAAGWVRGDRTLRCGVQAAGRSGTLYPITGSALQQNQSDVHPVGTCLGNDGKAVGDPVDCAGPHAVEIVGVVDLKDSFRKGTPDEAAQDKVLDKTCTRLASTFAGGTAVAGKKGLTLFWETLRAESWQAGSTRVDCRLGAFLPDHSGFAPVTGSVKGPVQVGKQPAPAAPKTPGPAPAAPPPVTQADDPAAPPP